MMFSTNLLSSILCNMHIWFLQIVLIKIFSQENIFCAGRAIGFARNGRQDFDAQIKAACGETGTANMPGLCRAACPVCATPMQAG